ncbi:uncharacterized protein LOC131046734 isoform X2 [Cryptomeria japonica]|uniref:uncharacterized protein LOC131046734 isoform X2 n=1 Tax=Cryptomeria japonica TaxID=3369 RepID=UPI0027DA82FA|nr:uncharacterized protein LOC131046734 isoform X2 [Cryptomeria japonica]
MVRSNKKAKHTGVDFKKVKHKVGRRLPPPKNATKVEVKTKAIILPEQSLAVEKKGLAVNRKQQTLKELLMQTTHHNANVRKDALYGIKDLFIRHPKELKLHKLAIIEKLSPRISDADKGVRDSLFLLFKLAVFPGLEEVVMGPLISIIMAHIFNAMTQLATNIRLMAFKFLDLVVQHYESTVITNYSVKVLQYYVDILGKTGSFFQDKGKLMDILAGLIRYLSSVHSSMQPTNSSPDQGKSQLVTLHGYKCIVPKKVVAVGITNIAEDGISVIESLQSLLPVLLEEWAECSPSVCSLPNPDNLCLQCMLFILQGFFLIFKCTRTEPYGSNETNYGAYGSNESSYGAGLPTMQMDVEMKKWVKTILPFLVDRLFTLFPVSPSSHCSYKVQEQFVALNTGICNVALEIAHWVGIDCLPTEQIFQYMKDSLEGQVMPTHHSKSVEKYTLSLICFIPRIVSQVAEGWKERLLRAFTQAFTSCKPNSSMKLACLSSVEEMLLHLVLQVLLHIGRSATADSLLCKEYTELQPTLMPFFSMHLPLEDNKVKMLYGPFIKLPKVCQELAIDSLYYYSSFSSTFLEALARCCLYSKLDISIVSRIIQVLQRVFGRGCIKIADHLSFLLTLIVSCKVIHDNSQNCSEVSEIDPDLSIGFGKYKVVTRIVCLCLSELGDESLVLGLIQPLIFQELAHKPSLDITCTLLRVVVVLSSRSMQLPVQLIHDLPHYIYQYLLDIAHDCMINENSQKTIGGCSHYILPCIFLFSRSEKLTSFVFGLLESSSLEGYESKSVQVKHLCAVSWVVIQLYKIERIHYRFSKCQSSTKAIIKNINARQVSLFTSISKEEKETLMKYHSQLKVTTSAVHKWNEKEI